MDLPEWVKRLEAWVDVPGRRPPSSVSESEELIWPTTPKDMHTFFKRAVRAARMGLHPETAHLEQPDVPLWLTQRIWKAVPMCPLWRPCACDVCKDTSLPPCAMECAKVERYLHVSSAQYAWVHTVPSWSVAGTLARVMCLTADILRNVTHSAVTMEGQEFIEEEHAKRQRDACSALSKWVARGKWVSGAVRAVLQIARGTECTSTGRRAAWTAARYRDRMVHGKDPRTVDMWPLDKGPSAHADDDGGLGKNMQCVALCTMDVSFMWANRGWMGVELDAVAVGVYADKDTMRIDQVRWWPVLWRHPSCPDIDSTELVRAQAQHTVLIRDQLHALVMDRLPTAVSTCMETLGYKYTLNMDCLSKDSTRVAPWNAVHWVQHMPDDGMMVQRVPIPQKNVEYLDGLEKDTFPSCMHLCVRWVQGEVGYGEGDWGAPDTNVVVCDWSSDEDED
jgi:hypothetical protein